MKQKILDVRNAEMCKNLFKEDDSFDEKDGENNASSLAMEMDAKIALSQLAIYFQNIYKNYDFNGFDDKKFHDLIKDLIKNPQDLNYYLELMDIDVKYFFKLISFIAPDIFTHNIIKIIRINYLKISPKIKK